MFFENDLENFVGGFKNSEEGESVDLSLQCKLFHTTAGH